MLFSNAPPRVGPAPLPPSGPLSRPGFARLVLPVPYCCLTKVHKGNGYRIPRRHAPPWDRLSVLVPLSLPLADGPS